MPSGEELAEWMKEQIDAKKEKSGTAATQKDVARRLGSPVGGFNASKVGVANAPASSAVEDGGSLKFANLNSRFA